MELSNRILSDITVYMKYAKFLPELNRRETWSELVDRNKAMHIKKYPTLEDEIHKAYEYVHDKKILPSMRSLQFAGKAIDVSPNRIFNCAALPMDHIDAFGEMMFLLLGGTGVGFSVQRHHVAKLPEVRKPKKERRFLIDDSITGWADAVKVLMKAYFKGTYRPKFDFSDIREKGAMLVTSGGKAPGAEPLKECLRDIESMLASKNDGDYLTPLEVHDVTCYIADAVLAGGIRRAALISLFSLNDEEMLKAKANYYPNDFKLVGVFPPNNGHTESYKLEYTYRGRTLSKLLFKEDLVKYKHENIITNFPPTAGTNESLKLSPIAIHDKKIPVGWWEIAPQRGRANNSAVVLRHKIRKNTFKKFWKLIEGSGSGEPGIYLSNDKEWLTNPCVEIGLRPFQFCNLVTINAGAVTTQEEYNEYARAAGFIATLQAGYTDFHYLRDIWKQTTEKDALLGVSMTGIAGSKVLELNRPEAVEIIIEENIRVAKLIGINPAARVTAIKPEGTSSLVLGTASGVHAWHDEWYIRRIRIGKNEAIYFYLLEHHPELLEDDAFKPDVQAIISIPQKAPEGAILRTETAIDLLERVKLLSESWIKPGFLDGNNSHNVSATISIRDEEWEEVGEWMWDNRNVYNGLAVLPYDGHSYVQAPFESCTKQKYDKMMKSLTSVAIYEIKEEQDNTDLKGEVACGGGACEVT